MNTCHARANVEEHVLPILSSFLFSVASVFRLSLPSYVPSVCEEPSLVGKYRTLPSDTKIGVCKIFPADFRVVIRPYCLAHGGGETGETFGRTGANDSSLQYPGAQHDGDGQVRTVDVQSKREKEG